MTWASLGQEECRYCRPLKTYLGERADEEGAQAEDEEQSGEVRVQARRSAAPSQVVVGDGGGVQQVHGVALDAAQGVAAEPEVALEVTDPRFDGGAAAEARPHLALGVVGGVGRRLAG